MCGIFGYTGKPRNLSFLSDRIQSLEYRGYDSAGLAYQKYNGDPIHKNYKGTGCIYDVLKKNEVNPEKLMMNMGIAHTRWATHGSPSTQNAHPFEFPSFYLIHNGIVENYKSLLKKYPPFERFSETDSELIGWVLEYLLSKKMNIPEAISTLFETLRGSFACLILFKENPQIVAIRYKSPLIFGLEEETGDFYLSSDMYGFGTFRGQIYQLKDQEYILMRPKNTPQFYKNGTSFLPEFKPTQLAPKPITLHEECHFLKEVYEQPHLFSEERLSFHTNQIKQCFPNDTKPSRAQLVACGSAYHASLYGKILLDQIQSFPSEAHVASEFRYRKFPTTNDELHIFVSQSGETADTLESAQISKTMKNVDVCSITTQSENSLSRITEKNIAMHCGTEISVAATKTFSAQLSVLTLLAHRLSNTQEPAWKPGTFERFFESLGGLYEEVKQITTLAAESEALFFLGKDLLLPIAMEGALKIKEIAYVHAEAFASGELKHGPLALIHEKTLSINLISRDFFPDKGMNAYYQIKSRDGQVLIITDSEEIKEKEPENTILLKHDLAYPWVGIPFVLPLQFLAFEVAKLKGVNVDRPRNLAKSVTVE